MNVIAADTRISAPNNVAAESHIAVSSATEISPGLAAIIGDAARGGDTPPTYGGSKRLNHSEAVDASIDEEKVAANAERAAEAGEDPTDLLVTSGAQIKGGPLGSSHFGGSTPLNHNENVDAQVDDVPIAENSEPAARAEEAADLPVAAGDQVKGGPVGGGGWGSSTRLNHNESSQIDTDPAPMSAIDGADKAAPEQPADLPVTSGDQVKGGPLGDSGWGSSTRLNHNDNTVTDADQPPIPANDGPGMAAQEQPSDLPVTTGDQVKGGPVGGGGWGGSTRLNHNESVDMRSPLQDS